MALRGKKKKMIAALRKSMGIVTTACTNVKMSRVCHYTWVREDEEYAKEVNAIAEETIDFAESQLHKLISAKDKTSVIFFLKTKAKSRGYIEYEPSNPVNILNLNAPLTEIEKDDLLQELGGLPKPVKEVKVLEANDGETSKTE